MPGEIMAKITAKGGLTLPKAVRNAVGLKPGDVVDVQATASGGSTSRNPARRNDTGNALLRWRSGGRSATSPLRSSWNSAEASGLPRPKSSLLRAQRNAQRGDDTYFAVIAGRDPAIPMAGHGGA